MRWGQRAAAYQVALLLAIADRGLADAPPPPEVTELPVIAVGDFAEERTDPGMLIIELRGDDAVHATMIDGAMRSADIRDDEIPDPCTVVLVTDSGTEVAAIATAVVRFRAAGCAPRRLAGDADAWRAAGLTAPAQPRGQRRPGEVPFIVPRGLCEGKEPAQVFE
jgi:hypothetical protein